VVKYSSAGTLSWAKKFGGTGNDYGYSVAVDASGNPAVTGSFEAGNPSFNGQLLSNAGSTDIIVGRLNP